MILKSELATLADAIRSAREARAGLESLSDRQIEVLRLIAEGLTTSDIATRLGLSRKTVETHRTKLMARLDIHDVASLVRYAVRVGLVPSR